MIFVGNRKQTVERDGVLVTLTPGMPIPEARTWPNLKRAAAMGRVYADAADGDAELIAKGPSHSRSWLDMAAPTAHLADDAQSSAPVSDDPHVESAPTAETESVDEIVAAVDAALQGAADAPAEQPVVTTTKRKR